MRRKHQQHCNTAPNKVKEFQNRIELKQSKTRLETQMTGLGLSLSYRANIVLKGNMENSDNGPTQQIGNPCSVATENSSSLHDTN